MKRYVAGVTLLALACILLLAFFGPLLIAWSEGDGRDIILHSERLAWAVLLAGAGFFLLRAGAQARKTKARVEQMAIDMMRDHGAIDHHAIATSLGVAEADVRRIVYEAQKEGAVPGGQK